MSSAAVTPSAPPASDRLVGEALSKSAMLWIRTPERTWPVWHAHSEGRAYVVCGPGEQSLPDPLPEVVELVLRAKDSRARLLTVPAMTHRVRPESPEWEPAATALQSARLNSPVAHHDLPQHWAEHARVLALVPDTAQAEVGAAGEEGSGAAPPPPSGATTR
ncbi:hypothetical protein [Luteipulveratus halotolerans]|uniref:Uncharacterized protein n=1 Tax=Luteipulveratus halotolerans TaxID=1631356 RepID=A0A0L6CFD4_9MICO|nr:hypothetical protein [Luteipulveratus halotolerans]KNX36521.1 hypothetical protein VV01_04100 [Luteipulveratus halotolerans]